MGSISFYRKKGTLRIYSQTSTSGDKWLQVRFQNGNIQFGLGPAFPEQTLMLDRNTFNTDAHYLVISDEDVLTPLPLSFEVRGTDKYLTNFLAALSDPFGSTGSTWTVGNFTWTGFNETAVTRRNGDNTAITLPPFANAGIKLVRVELQMAKSSTDSGAVTKVFKFTGVHFPRDQISGSLQDDGLPFACNGLIYGDVTTSSSFSTGAQTDT